MKVFLPLLLLAVFIGCSSTEDTEQLDLSVTWNLETNHEAGGHRATWTIKNNSDLTLTDDNWALYWNMAPRDILQESISAPVTMRWINGDFFEMKPAEGFRLAKGESITITYEGTAFMIKESDGPLGVYAIYKDSDGGEQPVVIADMTILPFDSPDQINRDGTDEEPIPTPEWLFANQQGITELPEESLELIVPKPTATTRKPGVVSLTTQTKIHYEAGLENEAELLAEQLSEHLSGVIAPVQSSESGPGIISLKNESRSVNGAYTLDVGNGVTITGNEAGVFYGCQSLVALLPVKELGKQNQQLDIPSVVIEDRPAYDYRGMFVDISRNFNSSTTLMRLIDIMSFYKLNKLHIHLSEDEAWRIEIEELPELTEIASYRGHTMDNADNLQPSYGSGPFADPESGFGSGFYTREEFKLLIKYAYDRHIEVIPEINVPGHSRAAIMAMEARYRRLMAEGDEEGAREFRLADPNDSSEYRSAQWYTDNVICVCQESAFRFVTTVFDDIIEMYEEAGVPLNIFHTGGDEVPRGAWTGSPICAEYLKDYPEITNPKNLQSVFFRRIKAYLAEKNIMAGGWEEIAQNFYEDGSWDVNTEFANSNVVPYVWNSLWGAEDLGNKMANRGYPTVLCNVTNFYFDLAYNKDPREAGLYWAGFVDTKDAYSFTPNNVFKSIKVSSFGKPYTDEDFDGLEHLTEEGKTNILGFQAQLWSETVKGQDMLEYYILPKLLGLAERAWYGSASWEAIDDREARNKALDEDWNRFANLLGKKEFYRMDHLFGGYNYRLAPPGATLEDGKVVVNLAYPGMEVRYTLDGSEPTAESPLYEGPIEATRSTIKLSTFDSRGRASLPSVLDLN